MISRAAYEFYANAQRLGEVLFEAAPAIERLVYPCPRLMPLHGQPVPDRWTLIVDYRGRSHLLSIDTQELASAILNGVLKSFVNKVIAQLIKQSYLARRKEKRLRGLAALHAQIERQKTLLEQNSAELKAEQIESINFQIRCQMKEDKIKLTIQREQLERLYNRTQEP